jgi:hypothetical protein
MKKRINIWLMLSLFALFTVVACNTDVQTAKSDSGVSKATVKVQTNADGLSTEQTNYIARVTRDNDLGAVKHLYIVSSYTGDVLEYYTVKDKVISGGKRLSPTTVLGNDYGNSQLQSNWVTINGVNRITDEVMDEYGMYGNSGNYLYWLDAQDNYHQYYLSGGTYLHISDKPTIRGRCGFKSH